MSPKRQMPSRGNRMADRGESGATEVIAASCCVVGGGPAGMMLGLLLARAGIDVVVLEKHADFLRDFRGDTIHPSTLNVMAELGLLDELLRRPHQEVRELRAIIADRELRLADFSSLPTGCRFLALMPQWDFLDLLAEAARRYRGFRLAMCAKATGLVCEGGRVVGVRAETPDGPLEVRAGLTVAADGRQSTLREQGGLVVDDVGAPMDVLWFRLRRRAGDPGQVVGRVRGGRLLVMIDRGDYWQCGFVIAKGDFDAVKARGLEALRRQIAQVAPFVAARVHELEDWADVKLLLVRVDRLRRWHRPGLLCVGDAAHAMSPIGGVGINLAIQDAVAAANLLSGPLARGAPTDAELAAVQRRREWPTRATQRLQVLVQDRVIGRVLGREQPEEAPLSLRMFERAAFLRRAAARVIGLGLRPEHVCAPASRAAGPTR